MKKFSIIICLLIAFSVSGFSQTHFQVVYSGNPYLAMNMYVTEATIDGITVSVGDEIGIFDGEYCVGAGIVTGAIDPYLALVASTDDPGTTEVDGFTPGHAITYRLWDSSEALEVTNVTPTYTLGDGTFSSQGTAMVDLAGLTNQSPVVVKPIFDIIIDEDAPEFELANLDTVFDDLDVDDTLTYSATIGDLNIFYNIVGDSVIKISLSQDWNGSDTLWITATDLAGDTAIDTIEITVNPVNDSPIVDNPVLDVILNEDGPDTVIVDLDDVFYDVDGDNLVFSGESDTSDVTVVIDSDNNATISLTANWNGEARLVFSAVDAEYTVHDTVSVIVNSINDPPFVVNPIADVTLNEDHPDTVIADLDNVFDDVEGDSLVYSCNVSDENVTIVIDALASATLSLAKDWYGSAIAIFSASDDEYFINDTVLIVVNSVNDDPTTPIIVVPENGSELLPDGYLVWTLSSDIDFNDILSYHIQLDDSSNFNSPEVNESDVGLNGILKVINNQWKTMNPKSADSAFVIQLNDFTDFGNLVDNAIYYWRVQSLDNNSGSSEWTDGSNNFFFNKVNNSPNAVVAGFTPADSVVVSDLSPTVGWQAAGDPDHSDNATNLAYNFQLSGSLDFASLLVELKTDPGVTYVELENLDDEKIYFYQVQTIDDEDLVSPWSTVQTFITNVKLDPPSDFALLEPKDGNSISSNEVTFSWAKSYDPDLGDYVNYVIYISQDSEFGTFDKIETGSDTMITVTNLDNGIHYWKVVAYDTDSLLTWGSNSDNDPWEIQINTSGLSENNALPSDFHLYTNYPNPFNPATTFKYELPKESKVVLSVFDMSGRLVETLVNQTQSAGYYSVQWDATYYSTGVYFYQIKANDFKQVKKCLLIK